MGSFDSTCCISNLPIGAGDEVKYILLTENPYNDNLVTGINDMWFPRTWPLRAAYNDYGSIEEYDESSPAAFAIKEGLKADLVEVGLGDNSCHDVPARLGMDLEGILEAIWEKRLQVLRDTGKKEMMDSLLKRDEPLGLPTLRSVEKVIQEAGFTIVGSSQKASISDQGFVVDEREYGWVRVRRSGYGGNKQADLAPVLTVLQSKYAAMMTCGTGRYADDVEIQVMPAPPQPGQRGINIHREEPNTPLFIYQGMVLADVWNAVVQFSPEYKKLREGAQQEWDFSTKRESDLGEVAELVNLGLTSRYMRGMDSKNWIGSFINKSAIPFTMGLAEHFEIITKQHRKEPFTNQQVEDFLDDVAGLACFQPILAETRYWWRPSFSCGPQFGGHEKHHKWHQLLAKVSGKFWAKIEDEDCD